MKYYKDPGGKVFAYEDSDPDEVIGPGLAPMSESEVSAFFAEQDLAIRMGEEPLWVATEMAVVADQLLMHEDGDDMAVATPEAWKDYRKALRRWVEGAEFFPDQEHRPIRPV